MRGPVEGRLITMAADGGKGGNWWFWGLDERREDRRRVYGGMTEVEENMMMPRHTNRP